MNAVERRMLAILAEGKARFGFDAVKAEFEAEGTRTNEFLRLLELARRAGLKVGLKIGGAEAVRDLIESRDFGVDYIIAPMVETPYALSKYIEAKNKVYPADARADTRFLFNVETITALNNAPEMARVAAAEGGADGMVFGRVDFVGSMGIGRGEIDSDVVSDCVVRCADLARTHGLELVVGGGVSVDGIDSLRRIRATHLDRFETRKIIFDAGVLDGQAAAEGMALALDFELLWLENKRDHYRALAEEDARRIAMLSERSALNRRLRLAAAAG